MDFSEDGLTTLHVVLAIEHAIAPRDFQDLHSCSTSTVLVSYAMFCSRVARESFTHYVFCHARLVIGALECYEILDLWPYVSHSCIHVRATTSSSLHGIAHMCALELVFDSDAVVTHLNSDSSKESHFLLRAFTQTHRKPARKIQRNHSVHFFVGHSRSTVGKSFYTFLLGLPQNHFIS